MTGRIPDRWNLVVVGARMAGALTAHALAPHAGRVLLLDRRDPATHWPQQLSWDRQDNLMWDDLGLSGTVLACGAPKVRGHTRRTLDVSVEYRYPADDEHCYRMSVPRHVLDPALATRAARHPNVTFLYPAKATGVVRDGGQITGVRFRHRGEDHEVKSDLVVFADGRLSRNADRVGAVPCRTVPSPWTGLLAYYRDLPLSPDRIHYSRQPGSMLIVTPCGPSLWCVAAALHRELIAERGEHPVRLYARVARADPVVGPALEAGTRTTPVGGAGRLRMLRRPMTGPGWVLVGDAGFHLDPMSALGAHAVLSTVRLLRDRVAEHGAVTGAPDAYRGLTERRDALLGAQWDLTERIIGSYAPTPEGLERARRLASDPAAVEADLRARMGLGPVANVAPAARHPARSPAVPRAWEVPPLAAPPESPVTPGTRASGRHTEGTQQTPCRRPSGNDATFATGSGPGGAGPCVGGEPVAAGRSRPATGCGEGGGQRTGINAGSRTMRSGMGNGTAETADGALPRLCWFWPERGRPRTVREDEPGWQGYRQAAAAAGLRLDVVAVDDVDVLALPGAPRVHVRGEPVDAASTVFHTKLYTWPMFQTDVWRSLATFEAIAGAGYRTLIRPELNLVSNDKAATLLHLRGVDTGWLPTITVPTRDFTGLRVRLEEAGISYPVVVKPASWGSGKGVIRAEGESELLTALRLAAAAELTMVVQPFVGDGGESSDIRVYCVNRRPVGALLRTAADGGPTANVTLGGKARLVPVPEELRERAAAVAAHLDTPWLAVDFLFDGHTHYLSEVEIDAYVGPVTARLPGMAEILLARFRAYRADFDRWLAGTTDRTFASSPRDPVVPTAD